MLVPLDKLVYNEVDVLLVTWSVGFLRVHDALIDVAGTQVSIRQVSPRMHEVLVRITCELGCS